MKTKFFILIMGFLFVLICMSLGSCVTEKQRAKICNACSVVSKIKDSIVYVKVDTTIYITTAGPTQYLDSPCKDLCDSLGNIKPFEKIKTTNGIKGTIKSVGKSIVFTCEADSLKQVIQFLEKRIYSQNENSYVKYVPCNREHKTKFDGFTCWWFWITVAIGVIIILIRAVKTYLKITI